MTYDYTVTRADGSVVATATGTHATHGLWAARWRRSGYTVTRAPRETPGAGTPAAMI